METDRRSLPRHRRQERSYALADDEPKPSIVLKEHPMASYLLVSVTESLASA